MTVSSEHRGRRVAMPEVVGLSIHDATAVLRNAGIDDFRVHYTETYAEERLVVGQEPRGGLLVARDHAIVLEVCRRNMVQYLPQVFQQSAPGGSFLRGYLYIVQQISDSVANHIARAYELFDPRTAREDFLPWLASWLAITLSPDWDELQRRKMLLVATRLFPFRGTATAIREFVRIYTGAEVEVEENTWPYEGFRIGVSSAVGLDTVILPPMNLAHCFVVRLDRPGQEVSDEEIIKIHQIIQVQKPAHTSYFLAFQDDTDGGEMAVFVEIGSGSIGVGDMGGVGIGVGVGAAEPVTEPEPVSSRRKKKRSSAAHEEPVVVAETPPAEAAKPAHEAPSSRRAKAARASKRDESEKSAVEEEAATTPSAADDVVDVAGEKREVDAEQTAKREARQLRRAEAEAERAARKERTEQRAAERVERSRTDIKAVTDEDLAATPAKAAKAKATPAKAAKAGKAKATPAKDAEVEPELEARRNERRARRAAAVAEREGRKTRAKGRAAERIERSQTDIKAITDADLADDAVTSAKQPKASGTKPKARAKTKVAAAELKSKGKASSGAGASKGADAGEDAVKREARRKRTADAAAGRQKRKDDAAKRAADRDAKKGAAGKGSSAKDKKGRKGGAKKK